MATRQARVILLLVRLGLVCGAGLIAILLVAPSRWLKASPTPAKAPEIVAAAVPTGAAALASSTVPLGGDPTVAAKLMIAAPPQTVSALQSIDPRRLAANFKRGMAAMADSDEQTMREGVRRVALAAALGYEPARAAIARAYPSSQLIRSTVLPSDAVRYSLDPLVMSDGQSGVNPGFVALMAAYFFGRHESEKYSRNLLAALSDDQRLQSDDRLQALLAELSRVGGTCIALARVVTNAVVLTGAECSAALQLQIRKYLSDTGPAGLEAESRHQALLMLAREPEVLRDAVSVR